MLQHPSEQCADNVAIYFKVGGQSTHIDLELKIKMDIAEITFGQLGNNLLLSCRCCLGNGNGWRET